MPYTSYCIATCECGEETPVTETVWPGTRYDPPDGMFQPEECPKCGEGFEHDQMVDDEPPDPY